MLTTLCFVAVCLGVLTGCAVSDVRNQVDYAGPFAAELEQLAQNGDELARAIIADSYISESELNDAEEIYKQCLLAAGFSDVEFTADGQMMLGVPESKRGDPFALLNSCNETEIYPDISFLYSEMRANPSNTDRRRWIHACLQTHRVLGSEVGFDQFRQQVEEGAFDLDAAYRQAPECDQATIPAE